MITVFCNSENQVVKALQVYPDGRESRIVDCQLINGKPDVNNTHKSIIDRFAKGEKLDIKQYPNDVFQIPSPPPTPKEIRESRYRNESDKFLLAIMGYQIELKKDPENAEILAKLQQVEESYLQVKTQIRNEVPDA